MRVTTALLFTIWVILAPVNSAREVRSDVVPLQIPKTDALAKNENSRTVRDCIITLLHIQRAPLLTTNCCLTRLCPKKNSTTLKAPMQGHRGVQRTLLELCKGPYFQLEKGCGVAEDANR
ncbi:hypothetical protein Zmor_000072 [Zophobas morio]|uniref:Uncharacterized protein n=1 Tax=Zophobas morio TaxID=2755281 RepID=A0AA38J3L1_9CUCU|nr:hypothetical protein Zmor_000072 [Zophobas morio]